MEIYDEEGERLSFVFKEFNLSEKIGEVADYNIEDVGNIHKAVAQKVIELEDVKEFIRRLHKKVDDVRMYADMDEPEFWATSTISNKDAELRAKYFEEFMEEIDKLTGYLK